MVLKDPLFKEMEDTVYSYNYQDYSDGTGYGMGHSYMVGDPTRLFASDDFNEDDLGNLNLATDAVYGSQAQRFRDRYTYSNDQGSYKDKSHSDFETVAALMDITMNHVGEWVQWSKSIQSSKLLMVYNCQNLVHFMIFTLET